MFGFSLTSPDLVICAGSPEMPRSSYEELPRFLKGASIEISLENGINGPELEGGSQETPAASKFPASSQIGEEDQCTEASLELLPVPSMEDKLSNKSLPALISINAGSDGAATLGGTNFQEDSWFTGGDSLRTESKVGDEEEGEALDLYQTARFGNFSYHLKTLERGNYIVDLHLAEIVFTDGPPRMRVFDVYIQEHKVVSCMDIYARVGANKPLIVPNLRTFVGGDEGLSIRFEGVTGNPLDSGDCKTEGEFQKLQVESECQKKELIDTRRALEELQSENECKSKSENECKRRECQEAWKSLKELQNELMRKSMHVGSLGMGFPVQ
ncbi:hypothetical protein U1Q18_000933 [Sarracenia purpurea var. burkii]